MSDWQIIYYSFIENLIILFSETLAMTIRNKYNVYFYLDYIVYYGINFLKNEYKGELSFLRKKSPWSKRFFPSIMKRTKYKGR